LLLFTLEMYRLVQSKLAPGGIMAMQSGSAGILGQLLPDIHRTLKEVFPLVMPYTAFVSSFMDLYGFQVAGGQDFSWPGAAEVAHRLEARGITGLGWFGPEYAAALPCLPVYLRARLNQLGRLLTDEAPFGPRRDGERLFY
jgi:spermidine synthase